MLLSVKNIAVYYGKTAAVQDVSLDVKDGTVVSLIGNNGAGKSTTLRAISGWKHPAKGEIVFDGQRIDKMPPNRVTQIGIAHVPENRRLFPEMTVLENLEMGAYLRRDKAGIKRDLERVHDLFPIIKERSKQMAGTMSGGQQQMVAMARALMSAPRLVVMDEPTLGLAPIICAQIAHIIKEINKEGVTIVLVEQNARMALKVSDWGYVCDTGKIILDGSAEELQQSEMIRQAYLGG